MMWTKPKSYRAQKLEGVASLKTSTHLYKPCEEYDHDDFENHDEETGERIAGDYDEGVIFFYCAPATDEARMRAIGARLQEMLRYYTKFGYMYYRSESPQSGISVAVVRL